VDARRSYDSVAERYAAEFQHELDGKPLDRALLDMVVELAAGGVIADVGGGPGLVAAHLACRGARVLGLDLSLRMSALVGSPSVCGDMTRLPMAPGSLAAIVCFYAVIHLDVAERSCAYAEFARVLRPGGHALVAFHVSDAETQPGGAVSRTEWWGNDVDLVFRFLEPAEETGALARAGLTVVARADRAPYPGVEHQSHRSYLLARRP
jgi:SAM-dependent methyltransferase